MNCIDEMTQMLWAEGELETRDAVRVSQHLAACARCRDAVASWRDEAAVLRESLEVAEHLPHALPALVSVRPTSSVDAVPRDHAWAGGAATLTAAVATACWLTVSPFTPGLDGVFALLEGLAISQALGHGSSLFAHGVDMITTFVFGTLVAFALVWAWQSRLASARTAVLGLALVAVGWPGSAHAAMMRSGDRVVIDEAETISETVFASAKTVEIDGRIDGDVFVVGGRVVIRGHVTGNVIAATEELEISGRVDGALHWAGKNLRVAGNVRDNAYIFGETLGLEEGGRIGRDAFVFGKRWQHDGEVGRDLTVYAKHLDVEGSVERDAELSIHSGTVQDGARIGGDLKALSDEGDNFELSSSAVVGGETEIGERKRPEIEVEVERYSTVGTYAWHIAGVVASFFVGLLLFVVSPQLFVRRVDDRAWLRLVGTGFLLLILPPVAGIILLVTVVGIPLGMILFGLYGLAVYLAQIIAAGHVALRVLKREPQRTTAFAPALALGIVVLALLQAIPFVGGWIGFAALLVGLGLLYSVISAAVRHRSAM